MESMGGTSFRAGQPTYGMIAPSMSASICNWCGASVSHQETHTSWHKRLGS